MTPRNAPLTPHKHPKDAPQTRMDRLRALALGDEQREMTGVATPREIDLSDIEKHV